MSILFLGASISAAFGLPVSNSFPAIIQNKLNEMGSYLICYNASVVGASSNDWKKQAEKYLIEKDIKIIVNALG